MNVLIVIQRQIEQSSSKYIKLFFSSKWAMTFKLIYCIYKDFLPKPNKANDNNNNTEAECLKLPIRYTFRIFNIIFFNS